MNIDPQTILDKFNQLPIHLQQEVVDYIDFLISKYGTPSPPPIVAEENSEQTSTEPTASEEISEKASTDNTIEVISEEDAKLDEEIAKIEEKNKHKITADWEELKSDFLNEFNR